MAPAPYGLSNRAAAEPWPRVALGPGAPAELAEFVASAGIEVLPFTQRHAAALYVDFVGARPPGVELLSLDLEPRAGGGRADADLAIADWQAGACLIVSAALRLRPALLTADPVMLAAVRSVLGVAASPVPVILSGEIGTGKYNLARLCHQASRSRGPLLTLNCARFDELDEHALMGAIARQAPGPLAGPAAAMLFLDELGELSDGAQLKLLRMLQAGDQQFWSAAPLATAPPVRFIAATNRALGTLVERGDFRRELYWRLNVFALEAPPLRQRVGDIALLARYFIRRANPRRSFTPAALKALGAYAFPGNVLELESLVSRVAIAPISAGQNLVDVAEIRQHLSVAAAAEAAPTTGWKTSREEARREMILRTIAAAGGNRAAAARQLGITTRALQYHITKAGLSRRRAPRLGAAAALIPSSPGPLLRE
ncbi:MAG TPA: sigma 54-interacting transcriptional regulator [Candidatus Binataceae bacterium]|nr:sigma 54-interacting transcriptional regulator [Candidatus Binataceae bacterium]